MDLFNIRKDFTLQTLEEEDMLSNPFQMLQLWLDEAIVHKALEPTAMTLSTASKEGRPSSRVLLLKEIQKEGLVFFSNHESKKGQQMAENQYVAVNFMWHELERQVRIEGIVSRLSNEESFAYYNMRPRNSRIGAWASPQSQVIPNRAYLDDQVQKFTLQFADQERIAKPPHWGGYVIKPQMFEFWQGRKNRLHDRIEYLPKGKQWKMVRLAP